MSPGKAASIEKKRGSARGEKREKNALQSSIIKILERRINKL